MIEIKTISGAVLRSLDVKTLQGADLSGANLRRADLSGANLRSANLFGADLRSANLSGANLRSADLSGADLRSANLFGADLRGADLSGANLFGADLRSADLRGATLHRAKLRGALIADDVRLTGGQPIVHIGPIGSRQDTLFGYRTDLGVWVRAGCWVGPIEDFRSRVAEVHADTQHRRGYDAACALLETLL